MSMTTIRKGMVVAGATVMALTPGVAHAYMGPGLGLGFLGAVFGVIGSIFLGIAAIVWYPVKRLWRKLRRPKDAESRSRGSRPPPN